MTEKFHDKAIRLVYDYYQSSILPKGSEPVEIGIEDVTVVWFCKTLQNWKALVVTHTPDRYFYEVTYNGDKKEAYIDAYEKFDNRVVPDPESHVTINIVNPPLAVTQWGSDITTASVTRTRVA